VAAEQAMIALTWRKDASDLPKLAGMALEPRKNGRPDSELSSIPYALHRAYGDAAVPYLENMLARSEYGRVRTESAQELMMVGRHSGFAFAVEAIGNGQPYSREMMNFVRERFPEMKSGDDTAVLNFVKARAAAK
jgi:hypothetical protein